MESFTDEFKEMCKEANLDWTPKIGDYWITHFEDERVFRIESLLKDDKESIKYIKQNSIWVPTTNQLLDRIRIPFSLSKDDMNFFKVDLYPKFATTNYYYDKKCALLEATVMIEHLKRYRNKQWEDMNRGRYINDNN
jgi:hypothetical protein